MKRMTGMRFLREFVGADKFRETYAKRGGEFAGELVPDYSFAADEWVLSFLNPIAAFYKAPLTVNNIKDYRHEIGLQKRHWIPKPPLIEEKPIEQSLTEQTAREIEEQNIPLEPFTEKELLASIFGILVEIRDKLN